MCNNHKKNSDLPLPLEQQQQQQQQQKTEENIWTRKCVKNWRYQKIIR